MDPTEGTASGSSRNVATNAEDNDALADLLSGASLECLNYVNVPITRPIIGPMNINQMNEYCLLALFNEFPLQQQLPLRAVCRQWNAIIEKKCLGKRSLKLFYSETELGDYCKKIIKCKLYEDDQFKLKPIGRDDELIGTFEEFQRCAHLFANIEHFVYYRYLEVDMWNELPEMFPKLTSLTTTNLSQSIPPTGVINLLQNVTSFHLFKFNKIPKEMPINLNQLEAFSLIGNEYSESICLLLSKLGPNLKSLMLNSVSLSIDELSRSLISNPALVNITTLTLGYLRGCDNALLLELICSKFTNLTYLDFKLAVSLDSLKDLRKLKHLTEIRLDSISDVPAQIPLNLPQVKSVKKLHITLNESPQLIRILQAIFSTVEEIVFHTSEYVFRKHIAEFSYSCSVSCYDEDALFETNMGRHLELYRDYQTFLDSFDDFISGNYQDEETFYSDDYDSDY